MPCPPGSSRCQPSLVWYARCFHPFYLIADNALPRRRPSPLQLLQQPRGRHVGTLLARRGALLPGLGPGAHGQERPSVRLWRTREPLPQGEVEKCAWHSPGLCIIEQELTEVGSLFAPPPPPPPPPPLGVLILPLRSCASCFYLHIKRRHGNPIGLSSFNLISF